MKVLPILLACAAMPVMGQVHRGEVRLKVSDPSGAPVRTSVELACAGNGYDKSFTTDASGSLDVRGVPYGVYRVDIRQPGFSPASTTIEVLSALPLDEKIRLKLPSVVTQVQVSDADTLIDPESPSSVMQIGSKQIEHRVSSIPGRSIQDLVVSQPGWLYEGNAVLHPRGSEYQTQLVVDGIPLTDNRSPSFGPEIEADDLDSMSIYTAGYPAEFGRKMGGVVELNTRRQTAPGLHGEAVLAGGSFESASSYGRLQDVWGKNTVRVSASGAMTDHYLNPVVPQNYTNNGTIGDFSAGYDRTLQGGDLLSLNVRHEFSRFQIPNELVQEQNGQIQTGDNFETMGTANYSHILSANSLIAVAGMVRDNANDLYSNQNPTPIAAFQHNHFREGYFKPTISIHRGKQEFKAGVESDTTFLHEDFNYTITDPTQFDPGTPTSLSFTGQRPDLEQSAFVEDLIHLSRWTVSAGMRWDHYQLLLNQNALSPRLSVGRYVPSLNMVLHASVDRIFDTPSFENILISSSAQVDALSNQFLRLPIQPSRGNFYEGGLTQGFGNGLRIDVNVYRRDVKNYADDDQLLNTGVSYPIAFAKAVIYGAEGKAEVVRFHALSGFVSYSYMVGNAWLPVTGGLFLGDDASNALSQLSGHFPDSQDQRNTADSRFEYQLTRRIQIASGAVYGSGLPFDYGGTAAEAVADYGAQVVDRLNFDRGRVKPQLAVNSTLGVEVYTNDKFKMRFQADGENLNGRLNVIDFGGLFSGNAIGPARSFALRLNATF